MQAAPDAAAMLDLHARHARAITGRAAQIFWVVEQAAPAHQDIAGLWAQMSDNRRAGAHWAATTLLAKPGVPRHVGQDYAEEVFWLAIDPGTTAASPSDAASAQPASKPGSGTSTTRCSSPDRRRGRADIRWRRADGCGSLGA